MDTVAGPGRPPAPDPAPILLASKTTIPPVRADALERRRLIAPMSAAATPVLLVVAPAGWGKTTLLAQWARERSADHPVGWLTIDAGDNDPNRFWTYVIAALRGAGSQVGEAALAALRVPGLDPIEVALPDLLNDLARSAERHAVVLDDYHLIDDSRIREAVEFLITYLPATCTLAIGARTDPALPLARWRGRGLLTEVRADRLRFGMDEVAELLGIEEGEAARLLARTEGWAAGVRLVEMALRGVERTTDRAAVIAGHHRHLVDYVSSEVLSSLAPSQRDFMIRASVLDRICAPLTDEALEIGGSSQLLGQLEAIDPFISRLDEEGTWYGWHPVVRDALRRELERSAPGAGERVLERAAGWYLAQGQFEQAIRQLLLAGDGAGATRLLLRHEDHFLDGGNIDTFLALAEALGPEAIAAAPALGLAMAWGAYVSGARHRVPGLLEATATATSGTEPPPSGWSTFTGSISTVRALAEYESDPDRAGDIAVEAVAAEGDPSLPGYSVARFALGLVLMGQGRVEAAVQHLEEAWKRSDAAGMPLFARLPMAGVFASALIEVVRIDEARALITAMAPVCRQLEETLGLAAGPAVGGLRLAEARLELGHGDIDRSRGMLERATQLLQVAGHATQSVRGLIIRAEADLEAGDTGAARRAVAEAREIARNDPIVPYVARLLTAMENRLGHSAARAARGGRQLVEEMTDRELSILRALDGPLSQREIGTELYLSINTVKGYSKSLYRKLGVSSREGAVERARELGII